jgi:hypothetical protein
MAHVDLDVERRVGHVDRALQQRRAELGVDLAGEDDPGRRPVGDHVDGSRLGRAARVTVVGAGNRPYTVNVARHSTSGPARWPVALPLWSVGTLDDRRRSW